MPDRYLREALLGSDRWNACTLDARDLYTRLLLLVDDYAVFDGRDNIIAQKAYMHRRDAPLPLAELQERGLIIRFTNAGRVYLAITQWGESLRGRRKYPAPPVNVDLPDVKYRGKYGAPMNWRNPQATDPVSILIDLHGRAVMPQPPEWRRIDGDWMPNGAAPYVPPQSRPAVTASNGVPLRPAVAVEPEHPDARRNGPPLSSLSSSLSEQSSPQTPPSSPPASHGTPSPATTPPTGNGKLHLNSEGRWDGLTEAQRLRWQEMFPDLSIGDQVERAGAWLHAHPKERAAYEAADGLEAYLIRWLLREARPPTA